jgi:valyl-tRNA synthetase
MYHFRYPLAAKVPGYDKDYVVVATTRPETMLGDTGVAVHPDDERYAALIKAKAKVRLPLVGREIPIVADEYSDPEKGTGAVKITPAHDFNDFEVGKRHGLRLVSVLDSEGRLVLRPNLAFTSGVDWNPEIDDSIQHLNGVDRFVARRMIVAHLERLGRLEKIEPTTHTVPHGDRSNVVIEPFLTDQWYVNAGKLAEPALRAVEQGTTTFVPKNWEKTYFEWMRNIQPWCISRQLWWGHRIPAWYGPVLDEQGNLFLGSSNVLRRDSEAFVAESEPEALSLAEKHYGGRDVVLVANEEEAINLYGRDRKIGIWRDEDVLDTWFSSGLWPFSTLGWPDKTPELKRYYPTSVLVTGFDIIFFWVARMMMMGMHFMEEVPFRDVYIHALVRDEKGQKMSKSKGNVMDPLGLIDAYGADALRFTLAAMAAQGRDIKLSTQRVEGYRNFATKLWNAARFAEMNECVRRRGFDPSGVKEPINRWIAGETERATRAVTEAIEAYKFNEAAAAVYEFVWGVFCDWYLELIKPVLTGDDEAAMAETRATVAWTLDQILKLLHPFMPYITEELWAHAVEHGEKRENLLALSQWPALSGLIDAEIDEEIGWVVQLISEIRSVRTEMNVPVAAKLPLALPNAAPVIKERAKRHEETISRLARLDSITFPKATPKGAAVIVVGDATAALPLGGVIDAEAEAKRLGREIEKAESDLGKMDAKLTNPQFMAKAKEEAVEEARERKAELEGAIKRLRAAVKRLETVS